MVEERAAGFRTGEAGPETRATADRPGCPRGSDPAGLLPSGKIPVPAGGEVGALHVDHAVAREVVTGTHVTDD